MYIKLFCTGGAGKLRKVCFGAIGTFGAYYIASFVIKLNLCKPMQRIWDTDVEGSCLNTNRLILASAVINLAADSFIWAVPLAKIYHLQLNHGNKVGLYIMFGLGTM